MKKILFIITSILLVGCAASGPSTIHINHNSNNRTEVAILLVNQRSGLTITACDKVLIPRSAEYLVLEPGRHTISFNIKGNDLFTYYEMSNSTIVDVQAGRTYELSSKLGFLVKGNKWFPKLIDVSHDSNKHLEYIPRNVNK